MAVSEHNKYVAAVISQDWQIPESQVGESHCSVTEDLLCQAVRHRWTAALDGFGRSAKCSEQQKIRRYVSICYSQWMCALLA